MTIAMDASLMPLLMQAGASRIRAAGLLLDVADGYEDALREMELVLPTIQGASVTDGVLRYPCVLGAVGEWFAPVLAIRTEAIPESVISALVGRPVTDLIGDHPAFGGRIVMEASREDALLLIRLDDATLDLDGIHMIAPMLGPVRRMTRRRRLNVMLGMHGGWDSLNFETLCECMPGCIFFALLMAGILSVWSAFASIPGWMPLVCIMLLPVVLALQLLDAFTEDNLYYSFDGRHEMKRLEVAERARRS